MATVKYLTAVMVIATIYLVVGVTSAPSESVTDLPAVTTDVTTTTLSPEATCALNSGSCKACVKNKKCFYCSSNDKCAYMPFKVLKPIPESCPSMADMSWGTCFVSYRTVWIVAGSLSGAILLVLLICCCYCCYCRKSGGTSVVSGDWLKWEKKRQVSQAKNDERRQERQSRMDEIRNKYGLKKDDDSKYSKF